MWDHLHGFGVQTAVNDIDVAYFDASDLERQQESIYQAALEADMPTVNWEVINQAAVHLWYPQHFGYEVAPLLSSDDAIATWPETATAVAVRLLSNDQLHIFAPYGLDDLFNLILRRNPRQVTLEQFRQRAISKQIQQKWPRVTIIDG
ncbi:MAG: nucleotidyltransferase family protein [Chloroflexota bacterium]